MLYYLLDHSLILGQTFPPRVKFKDQRAFKGLLIRYSQNLLIFGSIKVSMVANKVCFAMMGLAMAFMLFKEVIIMDLD